MNMEPTLPDNTEKQLSELRCELGRLQSEVKRLRESESMFRMSFENSSYASIILSVDGIIHHANNVACNLFGYTEAEICAGGLELLVLDKNSNKKTLHNLTIDIECSHTVRTFRTKTGATFQGSISSKQFINECGTPYLSIAIHDTIENKLIEQEIRKLKKAIESAKASIIITDITGNIEYANEYFTELTGYSSEEYLGKNPSLLKTDLHPKDYYSKMWDTINSGQTWEGEFYNRKKNGDYYWENAVISPIKDEHDNTTHFVAIKSDITDKKQITAELTIAKEKAEEQEKQFQLLFENMEQGFALHEMIYDSANKPVDYRFIKVNKAFKKLTRDFDTDISGKTLKEVFPNTEQIWIKNYGKVAETGVPLNFENYTAEFDKYYNVTAYSPEKGYFAVIFTDITENKKYEQQLHAAKENAEESDRLKTAFLQNISHEIRTPLSAITGFAELLTNENLPNEKRKNFVSIIQNNSNQLISLISDIITISTLEKKQATCNISKVCINDVIDELQSVYNQQTTSQNTTLSTKKPLDNLQSEILSDRTKITQVLSNLLSNAFKFTHEGFIEFGYTLKRGSKSHELEFFVKDSGIGIKEELQEKIFDRFRQAETDLSRQYGGTGLGLAISKAFAELLGGTIRLESEVGKGSTFYFTTPYNPVEKTVINSESPTLTSSTKTVLVAENEYFNFLYIEEVLNTLDIELIHAKDGQECVDKCRSNPQIDIILMDLKMPVLGGIEAAKQIKAFRPDVPIIVQSAYVFDLEMKKYDAYFDDYITKPINKQTLLNTMNKHIRKTPLNRHYPEHLKLT